MICYIYFSAVYAFNLKNKMYVTYIWNSEQYNAGNKVSKKISSGENEETYTYYGDGSLKTKVDRNGVVAEYIYDIFERKDRRKSRRFYSKIYLW